MWPPHSGDPPISLGRDCQQEQRSRSSRVTADAIDEPHTPKAYDEELVVRVSHAFGDIDRFLDAWLHDHGDERACGTLERLLRLLVSTVGLANIAPGGTTLRGSAEIEGLHEVRLTVRIV